MNATDYNETLELLATMVRPIKAGLDVQIENLRAENRNIRQRLTSVETRLYRRELKPEDKTTVSLRAPVLRDATGKDIGLIDSSKK